MSVKFTDITVFCIIPPIHVKTRILFNYKSPLPVTLTPPSNFYLLAALTPPVSLL